MRVEVVAGRVASGEAKSTAEGDAWRFKISILRGSGGGGHGIPPSLCEQVHVGAGVRKHVKPLEWKTRYDESAKLFDENLQNS
jgi:hypothetical protein